MLYNICYITSNWRLYNQRGFCYVARCWLYNKKLCYIAHPNLPDAACILDSLSNSRAWYNQLARAINNKPFQCSDLDWRNSPQLRCLSHCQWTSSWRSVAAWDLRPSWSLSQSWCVVSVHPWYLSPFIRRRIRVLRSRWVPEPLALAYGGCIGWPGWGTCDLWPNAYYTLAWVSDFLELGDR